MHGATLQMTVKHATLVYDVKERRRATSLQLKCFTLRDAKIGSGIFLSHFVYQQESRTG